MQPNVILSLQLYSGLTTQPEKMGDPRRPVIPISIGCHNFPEAICDFGASVNTMPKVIYEKILMIPCCTQIYVCSLQISPFATLREY